VLEGKRVYITALRGPFNEVPVVNFYSQTTEFPSYESREHGLKTDFTGRLFRCPKMWLYSSPL